MRVARSYALEFCWFAALVLVLTLTPVRPAFAQGRDFEDAFDLCPGASGWCIFEMMAIN